MKKYLIINHYAPLNNLYTEEILELMLGIASIENEVSLLLLQSSIFQLLVTQKYQLFDRHLLSQAIEAFSLFEFKNVYVEQTMLQQLRSCNLQIIPDLNIIEFNLANLQDLCIKHDIILCY